MNLQWLLGWWNLIFVAPFAVALVYLFASVLTGIGMTDADADVHADADADVDADADADADHDVDADGDAGTDTDADADADGHDTDADDAEHGSLAWTALAWLGVGRAPISLLVTVALLVWGAAGFISGILIDPRQVGHGWDVAQWSVPIALVAAVLSVKLVGGLMQRLLPLNEPGARPLRALVGLTGTSLFAVTEQFGMVGVRDASGDLHQVPCRVGEDVPSINKGAAVRLVAYSAKLRTFYAVAADQTAARDVLPATATTELKQASDTEATRVGSG